MQYVFIVQRSIIRLWDIIEIRDPLHQNRYKTWGVVKAGGGSRNLFFLDREGGGPGPSLPPPPTMAWSTKICWTFLKKIMQGPKASNERAAKHTAKQNDANLLR